MNDVEFILTHWGINKTKNFNKKENNVIKENVIKHIEFFVDITTEWTLLHRYTGETHSLNAKELLNEVKNLVK